MALHKGSGFDYSLSRFPCLLWYAKLTGATKLPLGMNKWCLPLFRAYPCLSSADCCDPMALIQEYVRKVKHVISCKWELKGDWKTHVIPLGLLFVRGQELLKLRAHLRVLLLQPKYDFFPVRYWFIYHIGLAGICGRLTTLVEESNRVAQADRRSNMLLKSSFLPTTASEECWFKCKPLPEKWVSWQLVVDSGKAVGSKGLDRDWQKWGSMPNAKMLIYWVSQTADRASSHVPSPSTQKSLFAIICSRTCKRSDIMFLLISQCSWTRYGHPSTSCYSPPDCSG